MIFRIDKGCVKIQMRKYDPVIFDQRKHQIDAGYTLFLGHETRYITGKNASVFTLGAAPKNKSHYVINCVERDAAILLRDKLASFVTHMLDNEPEVLTDKKLEWELIRSKMLYDEVAIIAYES